jgi:4-hydroxy-tetrahydrodipicolinate synthase
MALQSLSDALGDLYQKGKTLGESLWALKCLMQIRNLCEPVVMPPLTAGTADEETTLQQLLLKMELNEY